MNNKNHMRTTLKHTLAACIALGALMLSGTACTQDDPLGGNNPAGTQLLQLGKVTIAGAETATRSTDAATRADIDADATTGYTGIRKHAFVKTDELVLTLKDDKGATIGSTITATLSEDGTTWTLLPAKTYFTPGTTVSATHTPTVPTAAPGITTYGDDLVTAQPVELKADGTKATLTLTHANAMVEVTPPASLTAAGTTYTNLTISATPPAPAGGGAANTELLATNEEGTSTDLRHRTIAPAGATLKSISLTVNTVVYTVDLTPEAVVVAANKRYPITLKMSAEEGLTATVAEGTDWGVGGGVNGYPTGLTYYISTPADLEKLRDDVNAGTAIGADVTVLQTADIDMTGVDWTPIGNPTNSFKGSYNGNGYSIKNLTINNHSLTESNYIGLFGYIAGAKITGVHLRECTVSSNGGSSICAGTLVGYAKDGCIVTLCSATGSVEVASATNAYAGGLVGFSTAASSSTLNHYTRCTADVAVTTSATNTGYTCGFTGNTTEGLYAGCIASGKVTVNGKGVSSGFSHANSNTYPYHAIGCITNSEIEGGTNQTAFGQINTIQSCLATGSTYTFLFTGTPNTTIANVYLKAMGNNLPNATDDSAYGILTTSNPANKTMMKTLHYSKAKGYTTTAVDIYHWYANGIWQNNGTARPTIDMSYEGNPTPIAGANKVYRVNGYFVMAPGGETTEYLWNSNTGSTTMEKDPCAGTGNWSMPTMKDFEAMAGWSTDYPWSESVTTGTSHDVADADGFLAAFPISSGGNGYYWSSNHRAASSANTAWMLVTDNTPQAYYSYSGKANKWRIRCVQKQAFPTP